MTQSNGRGANSDLFFPLPLSYSYIWFHSPCALHPVISTSTSLILRRISSHLRYIHRHCFLSCLLFNLRYLFVSFCPPLSTHSPLPFFFFFFPFHHLSLCLQFCLLSVVCLNQFFLLSLFSSHGCQFLDLFLTPHNNSLYRPVLCASLSAYVWFLEVDTH